MSLDGLLVRWLIVFSSVFTRVLSPPVQAATPPPPPGLQASYIPFEREACKLNYEVVWAGPC